MSQPILIVGAGGVGSVVAHKCAALPEIFGPISLASRTLSKCEDIAQSVLERTGVVVTCHRLDADEVAQTTALLSTLQPALLINVALPYQDLALMEACLACAVPYLDTANYEPKEEAKFEYHWQWAYHERYEQAGLTALLGSGFDPGVTNVFTAWLLKHHFDEIHELDIVDVNGGDHGQAFATNFNPEINIREVTAPCRHWENGAFQESPPLSKQLTFDCPEGVGRYQIYQMYHEEMESLAKHLPSLRRARFWMSFSPTYLKHLEVLQNVGLTSIDPVPFQGQKIVPLEFLKAVLPDPGGLGKTTEGRTCIGVIARGIQEGVTKRMYVYNICDHQKCFEELGSQAVSYTTGVPAMIGAKMILEGAWRRPGVWNMEQFDPDPFMQDLAQFGLPWQVVDLGPDQYPQFL